MPLPANVNLASKFSPKLDQAFKLSSYTDPYVNKDYDFDGVNSIKVYTLDVAPLVDYDVSSNSNRYGGFSEITDTITTYTLANDKAFQKTLDRLNEDDSAMAKTIAKWLAEQMNKVIVPAVDMNRFATAATAAASADGGGTITYDPATVLEAIRTMNANCEEVSAPLDGRVFFGTPDVIMELKNEITPWMSYTSNSIITKGTPVGTIDGIPVVCVPTALLPTTIKGLFWHRSALLAARKLTETKILNGAWVVSGNIVQGRFRYDSFALSGLNSATGIHTKMKTFQALTTA